MSEEMLPTMTVIRGGNAVRINVTDYDPKNDKLPEDEKPRKAAAPAPKPEPQPEPAPEPEPEAPAAAVQLGLLKKGRRYFVVDLATSEPVDLDGIDVDGYTAEADAVAAAQAAMAG